MAEDFLLRLDSARPLAPGVRHLTFRRADGAPLVHRPGQFLRLAFRAADGAAVTRSYSIATPVTPDADGLARSEAIELVVSAVAGGLASNHLAGLAEGDEIAASGPNGRFWLDADDQPARLLLLATGTGIAPFRAWRPQLAARLAAGREVLLLHGARTPEDLLYGEEFAAFAAAHAGFRYHPCFSREGRAQPAPGDRNGYVQYALRELAPDPARDLAWLCGNPGMVDDAVKALGRHGFTLEHVRREKYVAGR